MLYSDICSLFDLQYPLFQGGMAWISEAKLAAAVSNGGGLGIIAAGNAPASYVAEQIAACRALTDKPFGVNVMLMSPYADEVAAVIAQQRVPVVTTGAGNPSKYMAVWREAGCKVVPVVPSVAIAKLMQRVGATAIIAEGGESGGHIGELTTMALIPQVCDAVALPVLAAGGIGDGRGVAAALMLGAVGVQVGTRFLAAEECQIHETYQQKILKAKDIDTIATGRRLGHPVRSLKTPFSRAMREKEYDSSISNEQLESFGVGALRAAVVDGDIENGCFLAGQIAGMVNRVQPAADIVREMCEQAEKVLNRTAWELVSR